MSTLDTEQDEGEKARYILQRYQDRLKVLRLGQEYSQKDDIPNAVKAYVKYLQALKTHSKSLNRYILLLKLKLFILKLCSFLLL